MKEITKVIILAAVCGRGTAEVSTPETRAELRRLIETAGGECVGEVVQNRPSPDAATVLGEGKAAYAGELVAANGADLAVFDGELTPSQIQNLEDALACRVIDRSMLILDIFALHAASREGKLQVELAQLQYTLPRLTGRGTALSRQGGGIGTRGPGESKLETDRRHLRTRISAVRRELAEVAANRATQRKSRDRSGLPRIGIIGYTNAGKSTLLNYLTDAGILAEDKLFATLDPTTRRLTLPDGPEVLLTDTIGFIRNLPHHLIEAFASTLDEVVCSDLLLHVVDASDPDAAAQVEVVEKLLARLGAGEIPRITVFNKCDAAGAFPSREDTAAISAKTGRGIDLLLQKIAAKLADSAVKIECLLPFSKGALEAEIRRHALTFESEYRENGIYISATVPKKTAGAVSEYCL